MLGQKLDYLILRPFTHRKRLPSQESSSSSVNPSSLFAIDLVTRKLEEYMRDLDGHFPSDTNLRYLDIGCGTGEKTVALAKMGYRNVTGVDSVQRNIAIAESYAQSMQSKDRVEFICQNIHDWKPPHRYDVLLSFEAFEHIEDPKLLLKKMSTFVSSNGLAVLVFGPLFHSPYGDHMWSFFRTQIPWRGVIFSEQAILQLRRECYRPTDLAVRYQEIVGGLNLIRFSDFVRYVDETGWQFEFLGVNQYLRRHPALYRLSNALNQVPVVKDYFAEMVYAVLRLRA